MPYVVDEYLNELYQELIRYHGRHRRSRPYRQQLLIDLPAHLDTISVLNQECEEFSNIRQLDDFLHQQPKRNDERMEMLKLIIFLCTKLRWGPDRESSLENKKKAAWAYAKLLKGKWYIKPNTDYAKECMMELHDDGYEDSIEEMYSWVWSMATQTSERQMTPPFRDWDDAAQQTFEANMKAYESNSNFEDPSREFQWCAVTGVWWRTRSTKAVPLINPEYGLMTLENILDMDCETTFTAITSAENGLFMRKEVAEGFQLGYFVILHELKRRSNRVWSEVETICLLPDRCPEGWLDSQICPSSTLMWKDLDGRELQYETVDTRPGRRQLFFHYAMSMLRASVEHKKIAPPDVDWVSMLQEQDRVWNVTGQTLNRTTLNILAGMHGVSREDVDRLVPTSPDQVAPSAEFGVADIMAAHVLRTKDADLIYEAETRKFPVPRSERISIDPAASDDTGGEAVDGNGEGPARTEGEKSAKRKAEDSPEETNKRLKQD